MWLVNVIKKTVPQRFLLAKMTNVPLIGKFFEHWLFEGDDIIFLPRDRVLGVDQPLDQQEDMVLPSQVVHHFIEKANHHWIMNTCICRSGEACKQYPHDLGCLFLGEAVTGINPRLGRHVTREEAHEHVKRCQAAGLVHLIGRNKLDTVWLGTGPGRKLLTICNCCPCCCLWRVLPVITPRIGSKVTKMPGVQITVSDRCVGCGICTQGACFVDAVRLKGKVAVIDEAACRGCGQCVSVCPEQDLPGPTPLSEPSFPSGTVPWRSLRPRDQSPPR